MNNIFKLAILILLALSNTIRANNIIKYQNDNQLLDISSSLLIYQDSSNALSFDEVIHKEFKKLPVSVPNLGISELPTWVKISITNTSNTENLLFDLSLPTLDKIEFYSEQDSQYKKITTGDSYHFNKRVYQDPHYLFDLNIPTNETRTFYIKIYSNEAIQLPIKIGPQSLIFSQLKNRDVLSGIYVGIMLVMILYNLFVYASVRDKSYLYYVIYILFILLTQTSLQGYTFQYLWPNNPLLVKYSLIFLPSLSGIFGMHFMNVFLKTKGYSKRLYRISFILMAPYFIAIIISLFNQIALSQVIIQLNSAIISIFMLVVPIIIYRKGFKPAKFFIVAWSTFLLGVITFILKDAEVLPFNNFTRYTMQIGSGIETILLSLALAARINQYKKERLDALAENERIVREQNIVLEQKVDERTEELNQTLSDLKQAQSQLVDAEKMSSLGQLTAGIAHEINNPINFVSSNIPPLKRDIKDLETIMSKYEELENTKDVAKTLSEIDTLKKELDFDYLKKELHTILNGIEEGSNRTKEIVGGLRNFSRLDEGEIKMANVNEGVESTLVLIKNKLTNIHIDKSLGEIPAIECYPGKLNQVFMNVLDNAIKAIKHNKDGKIEIETKIENSNVIISIEDNGVGMSDTTKNKIFEPFFTTGDVGEGVGLGLSITHSIIKLHNGSITVESEERKGTKFTITIPVKQ